MKKKTFTTPWANSADDKLMIFFLFFPENRFWHFMQIVSIRDNLHEMSKPVQTIALVKSGIQLNIFLHYENTPIQIYGKFYHQKIKIFRWKILIFFIFLLKT